MLLINKIKVDEPYCLNIEFSDGNIKIVDLTPLLNKGIFTELKNPDYFKQVKNFGYFISWNNDQELSAETLYYC